MVNIPVYLGAFFILTTIATVLLFLKATKWHKTTILLLSGWLVTQAILSLSGFYLATDTTPPRFLLLVMPPVLLMITLFVTAGGRQYVDHVDMKVLTILHTIRIPVELMLLWLYMHKLVPSLMTFEGRNFDILSGVTAPFVYYFGFVTKKIGRKGLLVWNIICLGLLINIVVNAILSAPFPFQQFAFDQPNVAILYFPFAWLPGCVVPLVLFAHLASIRQLLNSNQPG